METANTPILKQILAKLDVMDGRIKNVEERLTSVETRLTSVETRVGTLEMNLGKFYQEFKMYTQNQSRIQENTCLELCYTILDENNYRPIKYPLRKFFNIDGSDLTDFDGCLLIDLPVKHPNASVNNSHRIRKHLYSPKTIIIEAKHNTTKDKVDKKLLQIMNIREILLQLPKMNMNAVSQNFKGMVQDYSLHIIPTHVMLLFASDDIASEIKEYIIQIYKGIDESYYNQFSLEELRALDIFKKKFLSDLKIPKQLKALFLHSKSHIELYIALQQEKSLKIYKNTLEQYVIPFTIMSSAFSLMKENIGVVQFNKMYMPRLVSSFQPYSFK
jgi:hypothetical protein